MGTRKLSIGALYEQNQFIHSFRLYTVQLVAVFFLVFAGRYYNRQKQSATAGDLSISVVHDES